MEYSSSVQSSMEATTSIVLETAFEFIKTRDVDELNRRIPDAQPIVQDVVHALEVALQASPNEDDDILLAHELEENLSRSASFINRAELIEAVVKAYRDQRMVLRASYTQFDLGIPRLIAMKSAITSADNLQPSSTRRRRKQFATVSLAFDDESELNLACDLGALEQLVATVSDAHAEASRALGQLRQG